MLVGRLLRDEIRKGLQVSLPKLRPHLSGWHLSGQVTVQPSGVISWTADRAMGDIGKTVGQFVGGIDVDLKLCGNSGDFWEPNPSI